MYAVQKIAMQFWPGPEQSGEVIYTVNRFSTEEAARSAASMYNHELAGNMWSFRYIVTYEGGTPC